MEKCPVCGSPTHRLMTDSTGVLVGADGKGHGPPVTVYACDRAGHRIYLVEPPRKEKR